MKPNPIQKHFDNVHFFFVANSGTPGDAELKLELFQFIKSYNKMCKHLGIDNVRSITDDEVLEVMNTKV